ncbi:hypothetical protein CEN39_22150 [Fischerella thermalis CCMEE 5201]|uniref:hypothetical protein n=1 Tax=Fischerella thermalis TaxID=372787 RepID=UPI000C7FEF14|nr:hypothetical protein [Fischerella thermalis]PMB48902.1 hypothetical protein CEN39_22150 [Fischerella thermalis CCMEE 5201]
MGQLKLTYALSFEINSQRGYGVGAIFHTLGKAKAGDIDITCFCVLSAEFGNGKFAVPYGD